MSQITIDNDLYEVPEELANAVRISIVKMMRELDSDSWFDLKDAFKVLKIGNNQYFKFDYPQGTGFTSYDVVVVE